MENKEGRLTVSDKNSVHITIKNNTDLKFTDISSEQYREYVFANGDVIRIDEPLQLNVSATGGHRLLDSQEVSYYIPKGWIMLRWKAKPGQPHFVK